MITPAPSDPLPALAKAKEIAEETQIPLARIFELVRQGEIPAIRLGRAIRFDRDQVRLWLAEGGTEARG